MKNLNEVPFGNWLVNFLKHRLSLPNWLTAVLIILWAFISIMFMVVGAIFCFAWYLKHAFWYVIFALTFVCCLFLVKIVIFDDTLETIKNFEKKKREENND